MEGSERRVILGREGEGERRRAYVLFPGDRLLKIFIDIRMVFWGHCIRSVCFHKKRWRWRACCIFSPNGATIMACLDRKGSNCGPSRDKILWKDSVTFVSSVGN